MTQTADMMESIPTTWILRDSVWPEDPKVEKFDLPLSESQNCDGTIFLRKIADDHSQEISQWRTKLLENEKELAKERDNIEAKICEIEELNSIIAQMKDEKARCESRLIHEFK